MSTCDFVVPCGRAASPAAARTLDCLGGLAGSMGTRVVVVGAGVGAHADRYPEFFRWEESGGPLGASAARNRGARAAIADLIAFVDDDCTLEKEDFARAKEAFDREPRLGVLSGRIVSAAGSYLARSFDYCSFSHQQSDREKWDTNLLVAAFMMVRRSAFEATGGFDERMRHCEDVDLVMKIQRAGWRTLYAPWVRVVHHHDRDSWSKFLRYQFDTGRRPYLLERVHRDVSFKYRLKIALEPFAILLFPLYLVVNLLRILRENIDSGPGIMWHLPGVALGRLAFELGRALPRTGEGVG